MGGLTDLLLRRELHPRIAHRLPGRVRIHLPALKRLASLNGDVTTPIENYLSLPIGVETVSVNTRSGSVLVCYRTGTLSESEVFQRVQSLCTRVRQQWSHLKNLDPAENSDEILRCLQACNHEE